MRLCVFCGSKVGNNPAYAASAGDVGTLLAGKGIGLVYGGGHIGRVHKVDESIEIEELVRQAKIYALAAVNICGVES